MTSAKGGPASALCVQGPEPVRPATRMAAFLREDTLTGPRGTLQDTGPSPRLPGSAEGQGAASGSTLSPAVTPWSSQEGTSARAADEHAFASDIPLQSQSEARKIRSYLFGVNFISEIGEPFCQRLIGLKILIRDKNGGHRNSPGETAACGGSAVSESNDLLYYRS